MVRSLLTLFAVASAAVGQPAYDVLLKGGHVIDPKNNVDAVADVAVAGGKIARVATNIPSEPARQTIDATGLYVTPGLIDIHAHMWNRPGASSPGRNLSVHPDEYSFRTGVTTMVEPGTAGWQDFADVRARVVNPSRTRVLVMVNIPVAEPARRHRTSAALGQVPVATSGILASSRAVMTLRIDDTVRALSCRVRAATPEFRVDKRRR